MSSEVAERGSEEREVVVNHREDVLTEDLILEGIYRYTNFTQYGYSFDFPYVRDVQLSGDVTYPTWQIRELGKPCVVGTKVATKVLRDGDRVLVDAKAGKITRIVL